MSLLSTTAKDFYNKIKLFKDTWPLERVKNMTLEEYISLGNKDCFCYWLEHATKELGGIGGAGYSKFGVWQQKESNLYTWSANYYGNRFSTIEEAFESVKERVISIIINSQEGNFDKIGTINFHPFPKWKIAFIYSECNLLPIYNKNTIRNIAYNLGMPNLHNARRHKVHKFILNQKPAHEDFFDYSKELFRKYKDWRGRKFFILDADYKKYIGDQSDSINALPSMIEKEAIAIGFLWKENLAALMYKSINKIGKFIDSKIDYSDINYHAVNNCLPILLDFRPGDIIAIYYNNEIVAFAGVAEREGVVYRHESNNYPIGLGHLINVDFLETNININPNYTPHYPLQEMDLNYNLVEFTRIFSSYMGLLYSTKVSLINNNVSANSNNTEGINDKIISDSIRKSPKEMIMTHVHNQIQIPFARYLEQTFKNDKIKTEYKGQVDIRRESETDVYYYEVKPYSSAYDCIKSGIGQLIEYSHKYPITEKKLNLLIVGAPQITEKDKLFIDYIKENLKLPFEYVPYNIR